MRWDTTLLNFNVNVLDPVPPRIEWAMPYQSSFAEFEIARQSINQKAFDHANWDGYGAFAIGYEAKNNALRALSGLATSAPAPSVIPNPNGTLSFEWENENGLGHLEIGRTRFSFYVRRAGVEPLLLDGDATVVYGIGSIISNTLYPKPSEPAFNKIVTTANV